MCVCKYVYVCVYVCACVCVRVCVWNSNIFVYFLSLEEENAMNLYRVMANYQKYSSHYILTTVRRSHEVNQLNIKWKLTINPRFLAQFTYISLFSQVSPYTFDSFVAISRCLKFTRARVFSHRKFRRRSRNTTVTENKLPVRLSRLDWAKFYVCVKKWNYEHCSVLSLHENKVLRDNSKIQTSLDSGAWGDFVILPHLQNHSIRLKR